MVDKKTESGIKSVKSFLEVWIKFHDMYADVTSKEIISKDDEAKFLETKEMVRLKYEDLTACLDVKYMPHSRLTDPVSDILTITSIRFMSERNLKKLHEDWRDSYVFLNSILERLKSKKRRLGQFNPVGVFVKRFLERKQV